MTTGRFLAVVAAAAAVASGSEITCPSSHPLQRCGRCWVDEAQAVSGGCTQVECVDNSGCNLRTEWCRPVVQEDGTCATGRGVCVPRVEEGGACDYAYSAGRGEQRLCEASLCGVELDCVITELTEEVRRGECGAPYSERASCTNTCGKIVPHGWKGMDEGSNWCNECQCRNGKFTCETTEECTHNDHDECLKEGDTCFITSLGGGTSVMLRNRFDECPTGTSCIPTNPYIYECQADAGCAKSCGRTAVFDWEDSSFCTTCSCNAGVGTSLTCSTGFSGCPTAEPGCLKVGDECQFISRSPSSRVFSRDFDRSSDCPQGSRCLSTNGNSYFCQKVE